MRAPLSPPVPPPHVLREYALLADGERGVVVGPRGELAFMCFPGWADPTLFSSLIGGSGTYAVTPAGPYVWGGYYEPGTLIWRNRWITHQGTVECREALALPSSTGRAVVLRRLHAVRGPARLSVTLDPRWDYDARGWRSPRRDDEGIWRGRLGDLTLSWSGAPEATARPDGHGGRALGLTVELEPDERRDLVLVVRKGHGADDGDAPLDCDAVWRATEAAWQDSVPELEHTAAPRDARHAYAVMRGLTASSGAMVAAATMSLPERAQAGRNYDYRYAWIRDQCYAGQAVARAGGHGLLDEALRFVRERLLDDGSDLVPAYTCAGGRVPDEQTLDLPGYPGGADRIGNWVNRQFQLDVFGEALLMFTAAARHDRLEADDWRAIEVAAEAIRDRWREPDAGLWEIEPAHWTHSRLVCAAGLRSAAALGPAASRAAEWSSLADAIVVRAAEQALHRSGRWQRAPGDERVDAALVAADLRGPLVGDDPRATATLHAVEQELTRDGYVYRFRPDERPLGEAEGAFLLCGFWMSLAYAQRGDHISAARWFERMRSACGPPGLFSEEFDVRQRQLRGNLPQAFVHALLLETAAALSEK